MNDEDDEKARKMVAGFEQLPDFPGNVGIDNPAGRVGAYRWAGYMLDVWGPDAPFHALNGILRSIDANDDFHKHGWRNIWMAMSDLGRLPGPDDVVN